MLSRTDWINQNYRIEKKTYGDGTVEYVVFDRTKEKLAKDSLMIRDYHYTFADKKTETYRKNFIGWAYPVTEISRATDRVNKFLEQKYKTYMANRVVSREPVKYKL